jgi:hypothetical protein
MLFIKKKKDRKKDNLQKSVDDLFIFFLKIIFPFDLNSSFFFLKKKNKNL